jgi:hypothetical protein
VPFRNNIILAGETDVSDGRFSGHHTRVRRPPPAEDGDRCGQGADFGKAVGVKP